MRLIEKVLVCVFLRSVTEINARCFRRCAEIDGVPNEERSGKGIALPNEPSVLLSEDWFVDNVILHPTSFDATSSDLMYNVGPGKLLDTDKYHGVRAAPPPQMPAAGAQTPRHTPR